MCHVLGFQKSPLKSLSIDVEKGVAAHFVKKKKKISFLNMQKSKERGTVCVRDSQPYYFLRRMVHSPWMKHLAGMNLVVVSQNDDYLRRGKNSVSVKILIWNFWVA